MLHVCSVFCLGGRSVRVGRRGPLPSDGVCHLAADRRTGDLVAGRPGAGRGSQAYDLTAYGRGPAQVCSDAGPDLKRS